MAKKDEHVLKSIASDKERLISHLEVILVDNFSTDSSFRNQAEVIADSLIAGAWIVGVSSEFSSDDIYDVPVLHPDEYFEAQAEVAMADAKCYGHELPITIKRWCCEGKSCGNVLLSLME